MKNETTSTYQQYQRRELLKTTAISVVTAGAVILLAIGYFTLLTSANAKVEAQCAANGGQVLVTPGSVTKCLRAAR